MEWDAERRARWLYHNRHVIERDAYERGVRDAAVAAQIAELESQGVKPDSNYVDPEFSSDPSMMYTQEHIEAVYNPQVANSNGLTFVIGFVIVALLLCGTAYVVFFVRWGK